MRRLSAHGKMKDSNCGKCGKKYGWMLHTKGYCSVCEVIVEAELRRAREAQQKLNKVGG